MLKTTLLAGKKRQKQHFWQAKNVKNNTFGKLKKLLNY
jgi:hypothetical protein